MEQGCPERVSATPCQNSLRLQTDAGRETEQEKTDPWRTVSEVRVKSTQCVMRLLGLYVRQQARKGDANHYFECGFLSFDDSALHANDGCVRAVFGSQFGKDISDLTLHGVFAHRKLLCNLLICIAFGNQPQHTDFSRR